jgi:hypothetical protein
MDQAQSAQASLAKRIVAQFRDDHPFFVTDNDVFDHTGSVDQYADLAADIGRDFHKAGAEFVGAEIGRRDAPPVEALQGLDVT